MKAICIDDEQLALDYLERQIQKVGNIDVIGKHLFPLEGKQHIIEEEVDIVFLDIQMPGIHGIELAEQILEHKPNINIVFVTAYSEFAVDAFELNAIDYLIKPVNIDRIKTTINRIEQRPEKENDVKPVPNFLLVRVSNYLTFEVEENVFKPISWRTAKTQELFLYLLQNSGTLIEKSTLIDLLWEDSDLERAFSRLYTTVYNVRKALRQFSDHFILHNKTDGYLLELKSVKIDLYEWEKELSNLPHLNDSTIHLYVDLMSKVQEPYLMNHDYIWIEAERYRIELLWQNVAKEIAIYYVEKRDLESAVIWYKKISNRHPDYEDAHFSLMKLYKEMGRSPLVDLQYNQLCEILQNTVAIEPSDYIKEWMKNSKK